MTPTTFLADLRTRLARDRVAVIATTGPDGAPQAALVGFALGDGLELIFDTAIASRKYANLSRDPRVGVVIGGWSDEHTIQLQGVVARPTGDALDRAWTSYLAVYPSGHARRGDPGIALHVVTPTWARSSDFAASPATIVERRL